MIGPFVEAINDLGLPCSLTLVVPAVAASLATRSNPLAVALGGAGAMALVGWLRITGQVVSPLPEWAAIGLGILVLIAFAALFAASTRAGQRVTAGAVIGAAAASIWTPCVGEELGVILSRGPDEPIGVILPFAAFIAGISVVAIALALARIAVKPPERLSARISAVATGVGIAIALLLSSGLYVDVVARLVSWSL